MTNLHYIADEQLGGVEREYAEVERPIEPRDYVTNGMDVGVVLYFAEGAHDFIHVRIDDSDDGRDVWYANAALALDPTGNVRIDGTVYRMVDRNAAVGEKVLAIKFAGHVSSGEVMTVQIAEHSDGSIWTVSGAFFDTEIGDKYIVLEQADESLELTEADVRNNPRQVIDLIANLAGRLSKLESKVERLGTANQQAYDIVSRNVETWAQEFEEYKQSPAPWATQEQLVELTKQVAEIAGRKQSKDSVVEISEVTAKSALLIAEATELLKRTALSAEERREL